MISSSLYCNSGRKIIVRRCRPGSWLLRSSIVAKVVLAISQSASFETGVLIDADKADAHIAIKNICKIEKAPIVIQKLGVKCTLESTIDGWSWTNCFVSKVFSVLVNWSAFFFVCLLYCTRYPCKVILIISCFAR